MLRTVFPMSFDISRKDSTRSNVRFKDQNLLKNSFPNFEQIRRNGKLCDVTLIASQADGQQFSAHKIVLAATIPYFDAMFLSNMSEASKREIYIHDLDPSMLEAFIIFAYTGEIQITPANVQAVLISASFLQIDSIRNFCCKYIEERLTLENLISVRSFASSFLCSNLVTACDQLIYANFEALMDSPIFYSLTGPELLKMLESDDLQVSSEDRVFHAVIAWCEHEEPPPTPKTTAILTTPPTASLQKFRSSMSLQSLCLGGETASKSIFDKSLPPDIMSMSAGPKFACLRTSNQPLPPPLSVSKTEASGRLEKSQNPRLKFLPDLLARVRLPLLPARFIRDVVSKNEFIRSDIRCRDLLDETRDMLLLPDSTSPKSCSFICRPRRGQEVPGVIYAVGGITADGDCQSIVEAYHPLLDRWEVVESMSTQRSRIAVVVLNGCLYAIGGLDGTSRLNTVERFDPKTGVWHRVASMNYRRSALGAAVLNGRIYVCGGYDGVASLRTCEVYNPDQNRWQVIPSMTECRSAGGVVALPDGRLFAIGGHNGLPIFASVECYHRRGHNQRPTAAVAATGGGGVGTGASTTVMPSGVWRQVAPMLNRRCRHGVATLQGRIFAAGGYNGSIFLRSVEMFDPSAGPLEPGGLIGQWTELSSMKTPRSRVSLAASAGRLYAIGGFDGERNLNTVECFQRREGRIFCDYETAKPNRKASVFHLMSDDDLEESIEVEPRKSVCSMGFFGDPGYTPATPSPVMRLAEGLDLHCSCVSGGLNCPLPSTSAGHSRTSSSSASSVCKDSQFFDWQWVPAVPLIAHEGGVGVGVIPIY
ncbi:unnamed protein product [Schistocephalus solidus]|uniref:BTB domain-containing protein n=1 Tax=Schistocephalus solidus TaxID=70667 RepID=A0A3P7EF13_SCHSO|nr:unnamed protein product [Schistocephalus solidus]